MQKIKQKISSHAVLKFPFRALQIVKAIFVLWLPLMAKNPLLARFLPQWIFSLRFNAAPYKEGVAWTSFEAIEWMKKNLNKNMKAFEWGSGGSTFFIAERVKELVSVEHDLNWYSLFSDLLRRKSISNCKYILEKGKVADGQCDFSSLDGYCSKTNTVQAMDFKKYCRIIDLYPDNNFDFVFVDGRSRPSCIAHAARKIKLGGYLMLDDSERSRYSKAKEFLKDWKRKDFFGPKPYTISPSHAIVWQKIIK